MPSKLRKVLLRQHALPSLLFLVASFQWLHLGCAFPLHRPTSLPNTVPKAVDSIRNGNQRLQRYTTTSPRNQLFSHFLSGVGFQQNPIDESSVWLSFWMFAFASSHIGMSAIRQRLIMDVFGQFLAKDVLGIVGTSKWKLPDSWPGDSSGTNELFSTVETTGRQIYRLVYTLVSFWTLGTAFSIYTESLSPLERISCDATTGTFYFVATLAGAVSLASLVNASPLGLMPSFRSSNGDRTAGDTVLGMTRDDELKFDPKGLTRITRHPLILPVVPWGIATSVLMGASTADVIFFGGLALYAIAGCYCQDLRVSNQEGSVGTTFSDTHRLQDFYETTSFVPFGALVDGRQSWASLVQEFPIGAFLLGIPLSWCLETALLQFLGMEYDWTGLMSLL